MKPLKSKISITLDDPVIEALKELSEKNDRSLSSYINLVLKAHLEELSGKKEPKNRKLPLTQGKIYTRMAWLKAMAREQYPCFDFQREDGR